MMTRGSYAKFSLLLAVASASAAGLLWATGRRAIDVPLDVRCDHLELGKILVGRHDVAFQIHNPNQQPRHVVGVSECCFANCCVGPKAQQQVEVEPGATQTYVCYIRVKSAGPFEAPITLYLDDDGLREVTLTVRGVGVAPAQEPAHDPPPAGP